MIASKVISSLFFTTGFKQNILKFPIMFNSPCVGHISAGELNVI